MAILIWWMILVLLDGYWHLEISQGYLFWDIWVFVMYNIYGISVPSLLIESTNSMINLTAPSVCWHQWLVFIVYMYMYNYHGEK